MYIQVLVSLFLFIQHCPLINCTWINRNCLYCPPGIVLLILGKTIFYCFSVILYVLQFGIIFYKTYTQHSFGIHNMLLNIKLDCKDEGILHSHARSVKWYASLLLIVEYGTDDWVWDSRCVRHWYFERSLKLYML